MSAGEVGADQVALNEVVGAGPKYKDAGASGGNGTPYTIVIGPNGKIFPISGAQPYAALKAIVETALKEK